LGETPAQFPKGYLDEQAIETGEVSSSRSPDPTKTQPSQRDIISS